MRNFYKIVLLAMFSLLIACGGVESRKLKHMEQASNSLKEKQYDKARVSYRNVLKMDPKDLPARLGYAETLVKLKEWRKAAGQYRGIIEEYPDNKTAKLKLGQLYLLANEAELAMTLAEEILLTDGTNPTALTLKAGSLANDGKNAEALKIIEQAYTIEPNSIDTILLYGTLLKLNNKLNLALRLVEREIKNHPKSTSLHTFLSRTYMEVGDVDKAEKELLALIQLEPDSINLKNQLVLFYEKTAQPEKAEAVLLKLISSSDNKSVPIISYFDLLLSRGDTDKAVLMLRKEIEANEDEYDLQFRLASFFMRNNDKEEARVIYENLIRSDGLATEKAKVRMAYLFETEGKTQDSHSLIEEVLLENAGNIEALTLRGTLFLKEKNALGAISDLRTVLNADPDSAEILKLLGSAHLMNKDIDLAIDLFENAQNLQPRDIQISMQLAALFKKGGKQHKVVEQMEIAHSIAPKDVQIIEQLAQAYMNVNDADKASLAVQRFIELGGDMARASYYMGLIAQSRSQHEDAVAHFSQSLTHKPGAAEPMSAKVRSLLAQNKKKEALTWLSELTDKHKDNAVSYNLKAELLLSEKKYSHAIASFNHAHALKPEWWIPYQSHAMAYVSQNKMSQALDTLKEGIKNTKGNPKLRAQAALLAQKSGNVDEAMGQYEAILAMDANNKFAANNLAMLLVNNKLDEEGMLQRATELSAILKVSDEKIFADTLGWVAYANGQYEKALPLIKIALSAHPDNPEVQYHIGMVYFQIKEEEKAKRHLSEALSSDVSFTGIAQAKATLALLENS